METDVWLSFGRRFPILSRIENGFAVFYGSRLPISSFLGNRRPRNTGRRFPININLETGMQKNCTPVPQTAFNLKLGIQNVLYAGFQNCFDLEPSFQNNLDSGLHPTAIQVPDSPMQSSMGFKLPYKCIFTNYTRHGVQFRHSTVAPDLNSTTLIKGGLSALQQFHTTSFSSCIVV